MLDSAKTRQFEACLALGALFSELHLDRGIANSLSIRKPSTQVLQAGWQKPLLFFQKRLFSMRDIVKLVGIGADGKPTGSMYVTTKNKKTMTKKLELKKYCKFTRKHIVHRESK